MGAELLFGIKIKDVVHFHSPHLSLTEVFSRGRC